MAMVMALIPSGMPTRSSGLETPAEQATRVGREAAAIAQGHAEIDAGRGIEAAALEAWLDALDRDPDAPLPAPAGLPHR